MPYRNVIVGTDGSPTAELAVRHAGQLAAATGSRLVIVTAFTPDPHADKSEDPNIPSDIRWMLADRSLAEEKANQGRDIARDSGAGEVVVQTLEGDPGEVLIETAKDFAAGLIVVGSKGLASAARFILGSVASTVSHHAPCDVLVVHTTD